MALTDEVPRYAELAFPLPVNRLFTYRLPRDNPAAVGMRAEAPFGRRSLTGWIVSLPDKAPVGVDPGRIRDITRVVDDEPLFGEPLKELAFWMAGFYGSSAGEALAAMLPGGRREKDVTFLGLDEEFSAVAPKNLSDEQLQALQLLAEKGKGLFYLQGITGSGKTEVYIRAAQDVIAAGGGVIFLVPEISLTHQTIDALKNRFPEPPAVLHSRLTPSQRLREWRRLQKGETRLVIGARSAVFAPVQNLKLIVMDEEHENSYKSGSTPRYHARQIAMKRAADNQALFLMGSATPSLEAWQAMEEGIITRILLSRRLAGGSLPRIEPVSLLKERSLISQKLQQEMRRVLEGGRQVILFLNRRGFSRLFHCRSCGYEMKCRQCSVTLTYHKSEKMMVCHYCGYRRPPLESCPDCGSLDVGYSGFGTEHVEESVRHLFPDVPLARVDTDTVKKRGSLEKLLKEFKEGKTRILLGTQMVAKGLNFPGVSLVGIIMADTGLSLPDFRAAERTFALISQVAGRAGRYDNEGLVLVQSLKTDHPAVELAVRNELDTFYRWEIENRRALRFPPFARLIRLLFRSKDEQTAQTAAEQFADSLLEHFQNGEELLGPCECPLGHIGGNARWHIIIRTNAFPQTRDLVFQAREAYQMPSKLYIELDIDPVSLL